VVRALVVAVVAAVAYPAFSAIAELGAGQYDETVKMTVFPALVGIAAATASRRREPLPSAAIAAAGAMVIAGIADIVWTYAPGEPVRLSMAACAEGHAARGIIGFFLGLAGGASAAFVSAFATRAQPAKGSHRLAVAAGVVLVGLWACWGAAKLTNIVAAGETVENYVRMLCAGDAHQMETARLHLIKTGREAVEPVIECLNAARGSTRYYAVQILGEIRDERALAPLMELLERSLNSEQPAAQAYDQDAVLASAIPEAVTAAAEDITGEDFGGDPRKCLDWWRTRNPRKEI